VCLGGESPGDPLDPRYADRRIGLGVLSRLYGGCEKVLFTSMSMEDGGRGRDRPRV